MGEINQRIAEARGWILANDLQSVQDLDVPNWWRLRSPDGLFVGQGWLNRGDAEDNVWDDAPDYEHDLNEAWPLLSELPEGGITPTEVSWFIDGVGVDLEPIEDKTPQAAAAAICRAYCKVVLCIVPTTPGLPKSTSP